MNKVIIVAGPTGTGKTKKAIELAKELNGELINADSRQVYKHLRIGTNTGNIKRSRLGGRDDEESKEIFELEKIPIHLISFVELDKQYNVYEWKKDAEEIIQNIFDRGKQPIVVGGTGLYIDSLVKNYSLESTNANLYLRKELSELDITELQEKLKNIDSRALEELNESDRNNPVRLIRLIEKAILVDSGSEAGMTVSLSKENSDWEFEIYYPNYNWDELKTKIEKRVEKMFSDGLLQEADMIITMLKKKGYTIQQILELNVSNIMGYKQIFDLLLNKTSGEIKMPTNDQLKELIEKVTISHRQYARRQRTWFERGNRYDINKFTRF